MSQLHQYAETHEVTNQVPPLDGLNLYRSDLPLQEWVRRYNGGWADEQLSAYGQQAGGALMEAGFLANENKPAFKSHDRYGHRVDLVDFHPAYHDLMSAGIEAGITSAPWNDPRPGAQVAPGSHHVPAQPGRSGHQLPDDHDVRLRACTAPAAGGCRAVAAEDPLRPVRPAQPAY